MKEKHPWSLQFYALLLRNFLSAEITTEKSLQDHHPIVYFRFNERYLAFNYIRVCTRYQRNIPVRLGENKNEIITINTI
jgi:hypothetical protein